MFDFILDETFVKIIDSKGHLKEVSLRSALEYERSKAIAKDKALGIERNRLPFTFLFLPDTPKSAEFCKLAEAIRSIADFDIKPQRTQAQALWMRQVEIYYYAKAIVLANKIFKLIPDPTQQGRSLSRVLPSATLTHLQIETEALLALYNLLKAGEEEIRKWAKKENIDFIFSDYQELFIYILQARFRRDLQQEMFTPIPSWSNKRSEKEHYCRWLKFFADIFNGEPIEQTYCEVLRDMGWEGYPFLALRDKKTNKTFNELWKVFLKTHRATVKLIDTKVYWKDNIPLQSKKTSDKKPIQGIVTDEGYFYWCWR